MLLICFTFRHFSQVLSQIQMGPPEMVKRSGLIIEAEPEVRDIINNLYCNKYPAIAKHVMQTSLNPSQKELGFIFSRFLTKLNTSKNYHKNLILQI